MGLFSGGTYHLCPICGKELTILSRVKMSDGSICRDCFLASKIPSNKIGSLSVKEVLSLKYKAQDDYEACTFYDKYSEAAEKKKDKILDMCYPYSLCDSKYNPDKELAYFDTIISAWEEYKRWCFSIPGGKEYFKEYDNDDYQSLLKEKQDYIKNDYEEAKRDFAEYQEEQKNFKEIKKFVYKSVLSASPADGVKRSDLCISYPDSEKSTIYRAADELISEGKIRKEKISNRIVYKAINASN